MPLTHEQLDALSEMINIGVGRAAGAMNRLIGAHLTLTVPEIEVVAWKDLRRVATCDEGALSTVQMRFSGAVDGEAALVFPAESALKLLSLLTGTAGQDMDGLRIATLTEVGNILLNGVLGSISNLLEFRLTFSVPRYCEGPFVNLIREEARSEAVVYARTRFEIEQHRIEGDILLLLGVESLEFMAATLLATLKERPAHG